VNATRRWTFHQERYTFCITMRFECDSEKNRINHLRRGGLAFESAALVFVHVYRTENGNGEEETVRIISAREPNQRE
jgi:uncharacterized DUF497 family protein